jgi:hypothetical protein
MSADNVTADQGASRKPMIHLMPDKIILPPVRNVPGSNIVAAPATWRHATTVWNGLT